MDDRLWTWPQVIATILLVPPALFVALRQTYDEKVRRVMSAT